MNSVSDHGLGRLLGGMGVPELDDLGPEIGPTLGSFGGLIPAFLRGLSAALWQS